ncbi:MAG: hypothetical protein ACOVOV_18965, partial [Dolichospermum sp.]
MKYLLMALLSAVVFCSNTVFAQIGVGTNTPNSSTVLDVYSNSKGVLFPRLTSLERNSISSPAAGLIIFNTTLNCLEMNQGSPSIPNWTCLVNSATSSTSNGTAVINSFACAGGGMGNMYVGEAVSGVTHGLTVNVTSPGSYNFSFSNNGVTFSASGNFTTTGSQTVMLTGAGTPASLGSFSYLVNTSGGCSFTRDVVNSSTNGTAVVSSYNCSTGSSGNLMLGSSSIGVTQTITANVSTIGTYSINAIANNVAFNGKGSFTSTGPQNVVLSAVGIPNATGTSTFNLEVGNGCSFSRVINSATSNGTAVFGNVTCGTATGTLTTGVAVNGVSQNLIVDVTTPGTYTISTTQNGVTFSASGTL